MMMKIDKAPVPLIVPNPQDPRLTERVAGVTDADARDIGEEILQGSTNISSLRGAKRRSNPVSTEFSILDCFASLAMTISNSVCAACDFGQIFYDPFALIWT